MPTSARSWVGGGTRTYAGRPSAYSLRMFASLWRSAWNRAYRGKPTWDLNRVDPVFLRLLDNLDVSGPGRAIDMGCGTGDLALELARRGFSVVGVDWSATAIARAKQKAESERVVVDFRVDDVTALDVDAGGGFDLIVDRLLFCQLPGRRAKRRYVATLKRLTKPGGHVLLFELMLPGVLRSYPGSGSPPD